MKAIVFAFLLLVPLALAPVQASEGATLTVQMDQATYSATATMLGDAPVVTVTLVDGEGAALAGVAVRVVFLRQVQAVGYVANETITGTTDADGAFTASAPALSGAPGNYVVIARAAGLVAQTRYSVGA